MSRKGTSTARTEDYPRTDRRQWSLTSWPISRKLWALIILPLVLIGSGLGYLLAQSYRGFQDAQRTEQIANIIQASNKLVIDGNKELDLARQALSQAQTGKNHQETDKKLDVQAAATLSDYSQLMSLLSNEPVGGWPPGVAEKITIDFDPTAPTSNVVYTAITNTQKTLRTQLAAQNAQTKPENRISTFALGQKYLLSYAKLRSLSSDLSAAIGGSSTVGEQALYLSALAAAAQATGDQTYYVSRAISDGFIPNEAEYNKGLLEPRGNERASLALAKRYATVDQLSDIDKITQDVYYGDNAIDGTTDDAELKKANELINGKTTPDDEEAQELVNLSKGAGITKLENSGYNLLLSYIGLELPNSTPTAETRSSQAQYFFSISQQRNQQIDKYLDNTSKSVASTAQEATQNSLISMLAIASIAILGIIFIIVFMIRIARSITLPMRHLRSGAVDAATVRLPAAVRQIEREGPSAVVEVPPVLDPTEKAGPETREVAHALDGLSQEAIRLATAQVKMRQSLDEAFVSMSRRSQSMVEKQLSIIDELENSEEDPEQLRNLFRLDHLAARMRRYNDNLLVLAGSTVRTRSAAPVAIADVFRAATSEMEQYERVRLQPLSGAMVTGTAAGGLIHLLAELLDNAAMYSPPTSPIVLSAAFTGERGLHIEVVDSGVGIPATELNELNTRLSNPGTIDTQVPSRMGLFVVAQLARRGGFNVRLSARPQASGTVAEIEVPPSHVTGTPGAHDPVTGGRASATDSPRLPAQHQPVAPPPATPTTTAVPAPGIDIGNDQATPTAAPSAPMTPEPAMTYTTNGLPARRPGAALAKGPLAGGAVTPSATSETPFSATAPWDTGSASTDKTRSNGAAAGILAARRRIEGEPTTPADTGTTSLRPGLPRRSPGSSMPASGTPFAVPGSETSSVSAFEPTTSVPAINYEAEQGTTRTTPAQAPGHRPGAGSMPVRSPGQAGAPSAARAVAAAAAARQAPPTGSIAGTLFAATGPAAAAPQNRTDQENQSTPAHLAEQLPDASVIDSTTTRVQQAPPADQPPADEGRVHRGTSTAASNGAAGTSDREIPELATATVQPTRRPSAASTASHRNGAPADTTPIFDSISVWFAVDPDSEQPAKSVQPATASMPTATAPRVIDLRDSARPTDSAQPIAGGTSKSPVDGGGRWSTLGDQRWVAINARAAASPETAGSTSAGLPLRRPGANLLPSAAATVTTTVAPIQRADAESVRGRLGSYQRGLTSARRARHVPESDSGELFDSPAGGAPTMAPSGATRAGRTAGQQGGES